MEGYVIAMIIAGLNILKDIPLVHRRLRSGKSFSWLGGCT